MMESACAKALRSVPNLCGWMVSCKAKQQFPSSRQFAQPLRERPSLESKGMCPGGSQVQTATHSFLVLVVLFLLSHSRKEGLRPACGMQQSLGFLL